MRRMIMIKIGNLILGIILVCAMSRAGEKNPIEAELGGEGKRVMFDIIMWEIAFYSAKEEGALEWLYAIQCEVEGLEEEAWYCSKDLGKNVVKLFDRIENEIEIIENPRVNKRKRHHKKQSGEHDSKRQRK